MSAVPQPIAALNLRCMEEEDLPAVLKIESLSYDFPWVESIFRDCLRVGYCCRVLEGNDGVEAYGVMSVGGGESHILNVCVRHESRGLGLGKKMLIYLLGVAKRKKAAVTLLEVRPSNHAAVSLYHDLGFNEIGTRKGYYPAHQGREDALVMARNL